MATRAARQRLAGAGNESQFGIRLDQESMRWRDRILVDLDAVLEPWKASPPVEVCVSPGTRHFRLVKEVECFFAQYDLSERLTVDSIAEALGVPRRTLFHAFRKWLGIGPYAYLKLVRLHRLRDRLQKESLEHTCVSQLAYEFGFDHLSRLSAIYKKQFGEFPSDTLRRN